jgi:hypothetical protein
MSRRHARRHLGSKYRRTNDRDLAGFAAALEDDVLYILPRMLGELRRIDVDVINQRQD